MAARDIPGRAAYLWIYREWLASAARKNAIVVEVGVALGRSIAALCEMLDEAGRHDIQVYAVDTWAGTAQNGEQQQLARDAGGDFALYCSMMREHAPRALERVNVIRLPSLVAASAFGAAVGRPDLVVIDAAHDYISVKADIRSWRGACRMGAWIGGDDYVDEFPGVKRAVHELLAHDAYEVREDEGWGTWLHRGIVHKH